MTTTNRSIRIAFAAFLILALTLTALYAPAAADGAAAEENAYVAYADTSGGAVTGGAVTPPAVATPGDISLAEVAPIKDLVYNGKKKTPSPVVTLNGVQLKKNKDYTVSYKSNKLPGTATATIKGKAPDYSGSVKIQFRIIIQTPKSFKLKIKSDTVQA
jgi:hypothetical protein